MSSETDDPGRITDRGTEQFTKESQAIVNDEQGKGTDATADDF